MAGYCTFVLYFRSPAARENTAAQECNIQPYCRLTHQIIYIYRRWYIDDVMLVIRIKEKRALETAIVKPKVWLRDIDDIFISDEQWLTNKHLQQSSSQHKSLQLKIKQLERSLSWPGVQVERLRQQDSYFSLPEEHPHWWLHQLWHQPLPKDLDRSSLKIK